MSKVTPRRVHGIYKLIFPNTFEMLEHPPHLLLHLSGIHQLLVVLPPGTHVTFLRNKLGGFAVVGFQEIDGFLPFGEPKFVLIH